MSDETESESPPVGVPETPGHVARPSEPRRIWKRGIAFAVAVVLVGGGAGAAIALSSSSSGAASPSAAVNDLLTAAERTDVLGALDALAPGERQAIEPGITGLVHQLERLGILSSGTDLSDISGFGLRYSKVTMTTETLAPDLAAVTFTGGTVTESLDPGKLPAGTFVSALDGGFLKGGARSHTSRLRSGRSGAIVTEKVGGGWYVSLGYTIVFDALRSEGASGAPPSASDAIHPSGGSSADAAVRALFYDTATFDLSALISDLAPGEMGALQTYAPEILSRAESAFAKEKSEVHLKVTNMQLSDSTVNGGILVRVSDLGLSASIRGVRIVIKGGCASVTTPAGTSSHCPSPTSKTEEEERILAALPPSFRPLVTHLLTTHAPIGFVAVYESGAWFVSPTATLLDDLDAGLSILQPQDLRAIVELVRHPAEARAIEHTLEQISSKGLVGGSGPL